MGILKAVLVLLRAMLIPDAMPTPYTNRQYPFRGLPSGVSRRTAKMMREDLAAARRVWIAEADDAKEQERRENSDFLKYQDSSGRFADFHANRHTFITNLCKAKISPKTVQALARHCDIRLTMNLYSHVDLEDQSAAIAKLPGVGGKAKDGRDAG